MTIHKIDIKILMIASIFLVLSSILPLSSIIEFIDAGRIDMNATGSGLRDIPVWKLYIGGWIVFPFILRIACNVIGLFMMGSSIKVGDRMIIIDNIAIDIASISNINKRFRDGVTIFTLSNGGKIFCHLNYYKGAEDAIFRAIHALNSKGEQEVH